MKNRMARRNLGNKNFKGKKTYALMRGKFVEDVVVNHKDKELEKIHGLEVTEICIGRGKDFF
jgi:hypothetical protein